MDFKNLSISTRLHLQSAVLLALMVVMGLLGVRALFSADAGLRSVYEENTVPLVHLGETLGEAFQARSLVVSGMGAESSDASETYYKEIKPTQERVLKALAQYKTSIGNDDAKARDAIKALETGWKDYVASSDKVIEIHKSGDFEAATAQMRGDSAKRFEALRSAILAAMSHERDEAKASFDSVSGANKSARWSMGIAIAVGLVLAVGMSYLTINSIRRPLMQSVRLAERVAEGDLSQRIESDRKDELGQLLTALGSMQGRLHDLVDGVRRSADSISTASAEIAAGTQDLSQRTEQTASSLQSTASSMTQFNGTVVQSSDAARQASQLATSAADVAQRGGTLVSQVVQTMGEISASSHRITDIIGTIDGIAFQTNILALNAAVEAARAGEQGRGFAVVASEVRSLAQRSATAAKEIKQLIAASAEKVDGGTRLVGDAGQTMSDIVSSVQRVSDIIGEIASASGEQSQGIGRMSNSIQELDQMTQQNSALVEESAAAAESLKDQAAKLVEEVSYFKLG